MAAHNYTRSHGTHGLTAEAHLNAGGDMKKCTAAGTARRTRAAKVTRGEAEHVGEREREPYLEGTRAVEAKSEPSE